MYEYTVKSPVIISEDDHNIESFNIMSPVPIAKGEYIFDVSANTKLEVIEVVHELNTTNKVTHTLIVAAHTQE